MAIESATTLLERERELAAMSDALAEAEGGGGRVVLVEAPAGLGKTSLLSAAAETAADTGLSCLRSRASELECTPWPGRGRRRTAERALPPKIRDPDR